jgi:hypothetical protein
MADKIWVFGRWNLIVIVIAIYGLSPSCGQSNFAGSSARSTGTNGLPPNLPPEVKDSKLVAEFIYTVDGANYVIKGEFLPKKVPVNSNGDYTVEFELVPGSLNPQAEANFPQDLADKLAGAGLTATVSKVTSNDAGYSVSFKVNAKNLVIKNQNVGDKDFILGESAGAASWQGNPTEVATITQSPELQEACKIEATGNPLNGRATIVTRPSKCDFKMPSVRVGVLNLGEVQIGTYWNSSVAEWNAGTTDKSTGYLFSVAHTFQLVDAAQKPKTTANPGQVVVMDNGFILAEPTGKTYLLVDAGIAQKNNAGYLSAETVARDILKTAYPAAEFKGLFQPVAGLAADNYAASTVFSKGSVIALYDDTPDMSGKIDVNALTSGQKNIGLLVNWSAQLVSK